MAGVITSDLTILVSPLTMASSHALQAVLYFANISALGLLFGEDISGARGLLLTVQCLRGGLNGVHVVAGLHSSAGRLAVGAAKLMVLLPGGDVLGQTGAGAGIMQKQPPTHTHTSRAG